MRKFIRGASITFFSSAILFAINVLASIVLAPPIYGELSATINSMTLIGLFISSGVSFYVLSIGSKHNLNAVFGFSILFFIASCLFVFFLFLCYWAISDSAALVSVIYAFPVAAAIGLSLVMVGYFQLAENYTVSAVINSIPNLIKSAATLYIMAIVEWGINRDYAYRGASFLFYLIFALILILLVFRYRDKSTNEILHHDWFLAGKFAFSNFLVSAYTALVIPIVFLTYGAECSAVFSVFFIFWSFLNMIVGHIYGNHYLIRLKVIQADSNQLKVFFCKIVRLGSCLGLILAIASIVFFKLFGFYFWSEYSAYEFLIYSLLLTLGFRSISAAAGLFLSLGRWIKWKNIAQCIFLLVLYLPIATGADFKSFVAAYFFAEVILMIMYFSIAYLRVFPSVKAGRAW